MEQQEFSPARHQALVEAAKEVRGAIIKRAESLQPLLVRYDQAVEADNPRAIQSAALLLLMGAAIGDPVREALNRYARVDELLQKAESGT